MTRSILTILSGTAGAALFLFARNLALAALLPVEQYGIATTFALAMAAVEMAMASGVQAQIVQARDGDDPDLQAALQGFQALRGLIAAAALAAAAGPVARWLGIPEVAWAYRALALIPVLNGLQNLDVHRLNRAGRFAPLALSQTLPAALALPLAAGLAAWLQDWRALLWAMLAQAAMALAITHLTAARPFRLGVDRTAWTRVMVFGWPILANTLVVFAVMQGDRLAVGRVLGMEVLGVFSMGVTLTLTPALVLASTLRISLLPGLSAAGADRFPALARRAIRVSLALSALASATAAAAPAVVGALVAGTGFAALPALLLPLGLVQAARLAQASTTVAALALGATGNAAATSLPRLLAVGAGAVWLARGGGVEAVIWLAVAAETLGAGISAGLLRRRAPGLALPRGAYAGAALAALAAGLSAPEHWWAGAGAALGCAALIAAKMRRAAS